jgi:hypothetical protein
VLVGLVGALCFVGCVLPTAGLPYPQGPYQGPILTNDPQLVAFWPLSDEPPPTTAFASPPQFNGQYAAGPNGGSLPVVGQPGIVLGDIPDGASTPNTCALFSNGLVSVDFSPALNQASFTLEAWVQPNWIASDIKPGRAVLVSANTAAAAGFALQATQDNFWQIQIGTGAGGFFPVTATDPIPLNPPVTQYLAATFDNLTQKLTLFVGTVGGTFTSVQGTPPNNFVPESSSSATKLFIGMGRPDMGGMFPFEGFIQDVAIYNTAIEGQLLQERFNTGAGA